MAFITVVTGPYKPAITVLYISSSVTNYKQVKGKITNVLKTQFKANGRLHPGECDVGVSCWDGGREGAGGDVPRPDPGTSR